MSLKATIQTDLTNALKAHEDVKLQTLRMLSSVVHNEEIAQKKELDDTALISVIKREVKKRKEAVEIFRNANQADRANAEEAEAKILEVYLPASMSESDIEKVVDEVIAENSGMQKGQIVGLAMKKLAGQADGSIVSKIVNSKLA